MAAPATTKHIFVTGGVASSIGKGLTASGLGHLLRARDLADARYAEEVLARVAELAVSRQISTLKSRLQRLNPTDSQSDYNRTFGDLVALEQRRKALLERASGAL